MRPFGRPTSLLRGRCAPLAPGAAQLLQSHQNHFWAEDSEPPIGMLARDVQSLCDRRHGDPSGESLSDDRILLRAELAPFLFELE